MSIVDTPQRERALDPAGSFAVSAPAGSGKTELLTQRVLRLLACVDSPEEILCMTFTRKAAGEMRHRIIQALQWAERDQQPSGEHQRKTLALAGEALARDRECGWHLLQAPNRLRILTIDGFCLNLARQLSSDSGFGEQMEPLDNPEPHYRQVLSEFLLPALERQCEAGRAVQTLLRHLDNDLNRLEQLLLNLLQNREQWLGHLFGVSEARDYLENCLADTIAETLAAARDALSPHGSDLALLADYAATQLPREKEHLPIVHCRGMTELPDTSPDQHSQWLGLCDLLLTATHNWRARLDKNIGFPTEVDGDKAAAKARKDDMAALIAHLREVPGLREKLEDVRFLPYSHYPDNQWQALEALCQLLPTLAAALSLHFQQHKVCDFTEITLAALRALGGEEDPTELALKLDYQIRHILTDEFQDTSSIQYEILKRLTAGWQPGDGHSLFLVGDAMQSLYGFRNANVGLFLEARSLPIGQIALQPLDLSVNFRSQSGLIEWVNRHFPRVFPAATHIGRGAVPYSQANAVHPEATEPAVTIDAFVGHPDRRAEAERVVELVAAAKARDPEGSIAVLVRNRTHLPEVLEALQRAGHRWQAADIDPLAGRMPVVDLMSLTRALLSPADRIAWLAILRAPWCGLDNTDLLNLCLSGRETADEKPSAFPLLLQQLIRLDNIDGLSPEGQVILQRVAPILVEAWQQRQRLPLRCWIEGTWRALGGPQSLPSDAAAEECEQYLALLEAHDQAGTLPDWPQFEKAVQSLYATPDRDADAKLQVMTIHKAKGLEFDTVIIPGLNRQPRRDDIPLLLWQERVSQTGDNQLLIGPASPAGAAGDSLFEYLDRERKFKTELETARVLYVGVTRAIRQLHLLCSFKDRVEPVKNSLLHSLWPALEGAFAGRADSIHWHEVHNETRDEPSPPPRLTGLRRLPPTWRSPATVATLPTRDDQSRIAGITPAYHHTPANHTDLAARHTGTVLHRILRQIALEGIETWNEQTVRQRMPFWDMQLRRLGLAETSLPLDTLERAVSNCLTDASARWILDNRHPQSACEYAIGYQDEDGEPRTAVVDRTFLCDGIRWIIDYKTAEPVSGEPRDAFLARQRNQYRPQMEHYARVFQAMAPQPVRCALYFPLIHTMDTL